MTEIMLTAALRDALYVVFALTLFGVGFHYLVKLLGFRYADITDKLDNNPIAIGVFLGALALAMASLIGAILH